MNTKLTVTAAAVLACCASVGQANGIMPPLPPTQYSLGPQAPNVAFTDITDAEEEEYLLLECALKQIEGVILAKNVTTQLGSYPVTVETNGLNFADPNAVGFVEVGSPGANFTISGGQTISTFWGKEYECFEAPGAIETFNGVGVADFVAIGEYNAQGTILDFTSVTRVEGANSNPTDVSTFDMLDGHLIKDFYQVTNPSIDYLFDWGLQEISKNGFPQQKYWQRSESWPSDAVEACKAIVLDRLVGPSSVRIIAIVQGTDSLDWDQEIGHIYVTSDTPGTSVIWPIAPSCALVSGSATYTPTGKLAGPI